MSNVKSSLTSIINDSEGTTDKDYHHFLNKTGKADQNEIIVPKNFILKPFLVKKGKKNPTHT